jgi:hypothetical protein
MSILCFGRVIYWLTYGVQGMANLILLTFGNSKMARCTDLADATAKAISYSNEEGRILVAITPEGGGSMTSLEFDRSSNDWIAAT